MGGRYFITGSQIGILKVALENRKFGLIKKTIADIEDQFVFDSDRHLKQDVQMVGNLLDEVDDIIKDYGENTDLFYKKVINRKLDKVINRLMRVRRCMNTKRK